MKIISDVRCQLGENPLWNADQQCLNWTDIEGGMLYRFDVASQRTQTIYQGPKVGGFTLQENGDMLLFRVDDIAVLKKDDNEVRIFKLFQDTGAVRFNDVVADPTGRVFAGTIGKTSESGGLFRMDLNGLLTKIFAGTGCSNGMGFSPDRKIFYWTCSTMRKIFAFDYNEQAGALENRGCFYEATAEEGVPDGLTVDSEGYIWSARWGGACLKRHSARGDVVETMKLPTPNITSLAFGGRDLRELFITSAKHGADSAPDAGALFHLHLPNTGSVEFRSKIRLG